MRMGVIIAFSFAPLSAGATTPTVPSLVIRQVKVTGEEFVVLQATVDIPDLSSYWLGYASSDTMHPGSIVPSQQLPARGLAANQAVLLTSDGGSTCDAVMIAKLSMALADTKGTLVLRQLMSSGLTSTFTTIDTVNWARPSASGTTTATLDLRKESSSMTYPVWYHNPNFEKSWRIGNMNGCELTLAPQTGETDTEGETVSWLQSAIEPPAIIESINEVESAPGQSVVLDENKGLAPPLITETVPNPLGTGTDASDEYIELYNSNDATFDLSGFVLQTGLATKHSYVIPGGVTIPGKSFRVFYSSETGLSMSNTSGQASLLDSSKTIVTQSDPYDSAPDGQAWALANGAWYWTTKATPSLTNVIAQPIVKPATGVKSLTVKSGTTKTSTAKVKAATTKKSKSSKDKTVASTKSAGPEPTRQVASIPGPVPIHPGVLAIVMTCALGYGAYVYRKDLANAVYKLRRH